MQAYLVANAYWNPSIAPYGMSARHCPDCRRHLDLDQEETLLMAYGTSCRGCGTHFASRHDTCVGIDGTESLMLDDEAAMMCSWYHATIDPQWDQTIATAQESYLTDEVSHLMVHVGSFKTAMDRAWDLHRSSDGATVYLYEVTFDPCAQMNPELAEDTINEWPGVVSDLEFDRFADFVPGINRYLNVCENPGSISVMADARVVCVQDKQVAGFGNRVVHAQR